MSDAVNEVPRERVPHTIAEDALGYATGLFLASLGLFIIKSVGAVTGGTAGFGLLLSYWTGIDFSIIFVLVNVPFFVLALVTKGWRFTVTSLGCVVALSVLTRLQGEWLPHIDAPTAYGALGGNLLVGVGILVLIRHGGSLGGFNVLVLVLQERAGLRAGYVQMVLDVIVVLLAVFVVSLPVMAISALGAVVLNIVLAFNHKPGRYQA